MGCFRENWDNREEYLPKSTPRRKKKYPLQHIAATDTYYYWTDILLIQDSIQALVDACAQCAKLVDFRSVLAAHEVARADKLMEQADVVPCQNEHEGEGHAVTQSPPAIEEDPQQNNGNNHTYRHRDKGAHSDIERADEHLVLNHLLDKYLRDKEHQSRRYNREDEEWQEQQ
jgi:hypothetical protein